MKICPILQQLHFGSDVAEHDADLARYFVETSSFHDVVSDEADVILGPKGSGKTAIFRILSNRDVSIPQLDDVDILPAFNTQGDVMFRRLSSEMTGVNEDTMRLAWFAYFVGLAGNYVVETYSHAADVGDLRKALAVTGLTATEGRPASLWRIILEGLGRVFTPTSVEGGLTLTAAGPVLTAKAQFQASGDDSSTHSSMNLEGVLGLILNALDKVDHRCWLVMDRLDEAFAHDRASERVALRSLLRAHLDLMSYDSRLRSKLFLRNDLFDRITETAGFVNATHMRVQRIRWDQQHIVDLMSRRITRNAIFRETFPPASTELRTDADRLAAVTTVVPKTIGNQRSVDWILQRTVDAHDEPNPRNVLTLLRAARARQLAMCDTADLDYAQYQCLITSKAMRQGVNEFSRVRLDDTLYSEFQRLKPSIEALRGKRSSYSLIDLAKVLDYDHDDARFRQLVADLKYSGFMSQTTSGYLSVALMYRYALNMQAETSNIYRSSGQQARYLANEAEKAARKALETCGPVELGPLDKRGRYAIEYALRENPDVEVRFNWREPLGYITVRPRRPKSSTVSDDRVDNSTAEETAEW